MEQIYPRLVVEPEKLRHNVRTLRTLCQNFGIQITGVTKGFCADVRLARIFCQEGLARLGDSRVKNLKALRDLPAEKWLLRPPMACEVEDTVRYADVSLNSEFDTIRALDRCAKVLHRRHKVILMADLGDIREGYTDYDELLQVAQYVEGLDYVDLYGIGTNLTCFSFIQSSTEKMEQLISLCRRIEARIGRQLEVVSGGNSATLDLMLQGGIPQGVNSLRLGESLLFGRERARYQYLPDTFSDAFTLQCQIVELKTKPSLPWGVVGTDSYGNSPHFVDRGSSRLKAVCAIGKQDFDLETTRAADPGIILLGCSSDHLMLDVTDSKRSYQVGDVVELIPGYFSLLRAFTSPYVEKDFVPT